MLKSILKLEEIGMFIFGIYLFSQLNYAWWWFLVLIFTPDFSMVGYLFGNKMGAISYNIFHHKGIAVLIYLMGIFFSKFLVATYRDYFIFACIIRQNFGLRIKT